MRGSSDRGGRPVVVLFATSNRGKLEEARAILVEANLHKLVDVMTVERRDSKQVDGLRRRSPLRER